MSKRRYNYVEIREQSKCFRCKRSRYFIDRQAEQISTFCAQPHDNGCFLCYYLPRRRNSREHYDERGLGYRLYKKLVSAKKILKRITRAEVIGFLPF